MHVLRDRIGGGDDEAHVRIFGFAQRRRDANIDGVQFPDDGEVAGGAKLAALDQRPENIVRDVLDVGIGRCSTGRPSRC